MRLIAAALVVSLTTAHAQVSLVPNKEFLAGWVKETLDRRSDKSWTPSLYANGNLAALLGTLNGLAVQTDDSLPAGALVIKGAGVRPPPQTPLDPPGGVFDGTAMAVYNGIAVN